MGEELFICPEGAPARVDKVLSNAFPQKSRSLIQRAIEINKVRWKDGKHLEAKSKVCSGDELIIDLEREKTEPLVGKNIALDVLFEDEDILVINKVSGMVVHPGDGTKDDTLVHALLHHCKNGLCPVGAPERPGIVHRLDKDTSGLIVVALSERARGYLIQTLERREVVREYLAVVNGCPISGGNIDAPIGRHPRDRIKMAVTETGKSAETQYRVLKRFRSHSLLGLKLKSGRTHQIRVHMTHLGFPLVGDSLYGSRVRIPSQASDQVIDALRKFGRQALHATQLGFDHPVSGESLLWTSPMPADMDLLTKALSEDAEQTCF